MFIMSSQSILVFIGMLVGCVFAIWLMGEFAHSVINKITIKKGGNDKTNNNIS